MKILLENICYSLIAMYLALASVYRTLRPMLIYLLALFYLVANFSYSTYVFLNEESLGGTFYEGGMHQYDTSYEDEMYEYNMNETLSNAIFSQGCILVSMMFVLVCNKSYSLMVSLLTFISSVAEVGVFILHYELNSSNCNPTVLKVYGVFLLLNTIVVFIVALKRLPHYSSLIGNNDDSHESKSMFTHFEHLTIFNNTVEEIFNRQRIFPSSKFKDNYDASIDMTEDINHTVIEVKILSEDTRIDVATANSSHIVIEMENLNNELATAKEEIGNVCTICLEGLDSYPIDALLVKFKKPCKDIYHLICIHNWFEASYIEHCKSRNGAKEYVPKCPTCQMSFEE